MTLAVVGQGAIASLFCYYLRSHNPIVLTRDGMGKRVSLNLLTQERVTLDNKISSVKQPSITNLDCIFICVKSYHIESLIVDISQWLEPTTTLVLIQNGMGGAALLQKAFATNELLVGTTTDAVYQQKPSEYIVTAEGRLDIGRYKPQADKAHLGLKTTDLAILNCHPQLKVHENIQIPLLQKLAVNAVINPLTAVLDITNGDLRRYPERVKSLKSEINCVYRAMTNDTPLQHVPELQANQINCLIDKVIEYTENNFSSMHQDIKNKRQTEIDSVLGYLMTQAAKFSVSVPNIDKLYAEARTKSGR
jgi:2-dehydropantoate 2-reductase